MNKVSWLTVAFITLKQEVYERTIMILLNSHRRYLLYNILEYIDTTSKAKYYIKITVMRGVH